MAVVRDVRPSYRFKLEFDGLQQAYFQKASGLVAKVTVRKYDDGGDVLPTKLAGKMEFDDLQLEYGATKNLEMWKWLAAARTGAALKKSGAVIQLDETGKEVERWNILGAFPVEFTAGEWDATSTDGNTIRKVTITYDEYKPG